MRNSDGRPTIVVANDTFPDPAKVIDAFSGRANIRIGDFATPDSAGTSSEGADALIVATQRLSVDIVDALAPRLAVIGRTGVGLDSIDLVRCADLGITVVNQPSYGATEVASQAIAMMLILQRKLLVQDAFVRAGWRGGLVLAPLKPLDELTLGLLGCGRIGAETARLAREMFGQVLAYDPYTTQLPECVRRVDTLADLLSASDVLSIHSPLTDDTRNMLGPAQLDLLPAGAIVINVARGGILDEAALADRLASGRIGGAGLDVFAIEPLPVDSALRSAPNAVLTPHVAAYSDRSMWRLASWTIEDVLCWLAGRTIEHGNVAVAGTR